jgi:hypothetical protein
MTAKPCLELPEDWEQWLAHVPEFLDVRQKPITIGDLAERLVKLRGERDRKVRQSQS